MMMMTMMMADVKLVGRRSVQGGITHALVAEFEDEDDREFYIKEDPAHLACSRKMMPHLEEVRVVDFTPSVF